ncbi:hypothetical protein [Pseudohaliea rubra]|uniref:Uncharacterized protein n=1 Tax=Pseudohaliea rubra DSM 19751 TaxID=1265313 RepID=A0A095XX90_9GAMM|nr:hypothetical protein [Pseudohaliea rubra]KGE04321.1 hypothetical protein HRUBRA_01007 [Pseudohaliea rubra DSM 19751]
MRLSGVAVREYQTDIGPADHVLFVDRLAVAVVEARLFGSLVGIS